jgi:uncharacterized protein YkwD
MRLPFLLAPCIVACVPTAEPPPSTGSSSAGQAIAWAAEAAAVTGVQEAEKNAAKNAPPYRSYCAGDYDHDCYVGPIQEDDRAGVEDMTLAQARSHTLMYINGMRSLRGIALVELDDTLNAFAQEGSEQLARDHRPHGHLVDQRAQCPGCGENQGDPNGWRPAPVSKQIDEMLGGMMAEGPRGGHHDVLLYPRWGRLGVGIVNPGGRVYFTTDFAP